jgi:hypothetical protein
MIAYSKARNIKITLRFQIGQDWRKPDAETQGKNRCTTPPESANPLKTRAFRGSVPFKFLFLTEARPIPDTPKTLASTLPLPPDLRKIVKKNIAGCDTWTSHPATAELRKVRHDNFAPCDSLMSHLATSRHRTLRHRAIAPCGFRLSHPATQKPRFRPQNLAQLPPCHAYYIMSARAREVAFSSLAHRGGDRPSADLDYRCAIATRKSLN